jgi:hypothetical protein
MKLGQCQIKDSTSFMMYVSADRQYMLKLFYSTTACTPHLQPVAGTLIPLNWCSGGIYMMTPTDYSAQIPIGMNFTYYVVTAYTGAASTGNHSSDYFSNNHVCNQGYMID